MNNSIVIAIRCSSYDQAEVTAAVQEALSRLEPLDLPAGGRILLKPNCLSSAGGPEAAVNTRAEVVEAVGRYLQRNHTSNLIIADSGGMDSYDQTKQTYENMGFDKVAEGLGADLGNLEAGGLIWKESPVGQVLPRFQATALVDQVEAIVNLPKLKTHLLTGMTGAVKNCLGLLPAGLKRSVHTAAPTGTLMSQALVDIYAAIAPQLHLMDAVVAMEGAGPSAGQPRQAGWLLASHDGVALDYVAAHMAGFDPARLVIIASAAQAGLGRASREEIKLVGADWEELILPGFKLPTSRQMNYLSQIAPRGPLGWLVDWITEAKPRPIPQNCKACGICVDACPAVALSLEDDILSLDRDRCIECYCCLEHCPSKAFWVPRSLTDRIFGRRGQ